MGPLRDFLAELEVALRRGASASADGAASADLAAFARLARSIDPAGSVPARTSPGLPVCRFWDGALDAADRGPTAVLSAVLRKLGGHLSWTQNPNYRRHPPDPRFLDNYGYAVLAGPPDGPPPLAVDGHLALGVLLLGPGTHYPLHHHPAVEVYVVASGRAEWWRGDGPWRHEVAGAVIHHAPDVRHAMRTDAEPLLAIYLWRGDLATHARLTDGSSG